MLFVLVGTVVIVMPLSCRGNGGAGPSIRIPNEALVEADCDWIIVCPCGFTIEDTKKEEDLLSTKSWWYAAMQSHPHDHILHHAVEILQLDGLLEW